MGNQGHSIGKPMGPEVGVLDMNLWALGTGCQLPPHGLLIHTLSMPHPWAMGHSYVWVPHGAWVYTPSAMYSWVLCTHICMVPPWVADAYPWYCVPMGTIQSYPHGYPMGVVRHIYVYLWVGQMQLYVGAP